MLRRLTNNNEIKYLKTFVDLVEPVKTYSRHRQGVKYTQASPLTRVVDAAYPESMQARSFNKLVDKYIETTNEELKLKLFERFNIWKNNHENLVANIAASPVLKEIESLSEDLMIISRIGITALTDYSNYIKHDEKWLNEVKAKIESAKKPRGQTELKVVNAIEKLVNFVYSGN
jgi:hexosaminidase